MDVDVKSEEQDIEYSILIRAVSGKRKISTRVQPKDSEKIQLQIHNLYKLHMDSLKAKLTKSEKKLLLAAESEKSGGTNRKSWNRNRKKVVGESNTPE
jgi:hypothetical protein